MVSVRICFVPLEAKFVGALHLLFNQSVTSTNLKRDTSNTEYCLCDWVQLMGVDILLFSL